MRGVEASPKRTRPLAFFPACGSCCGLPCAPFELPAVARAYPQRRSTPASLLFSKLQNPVPRSSALLADHHPYADLQDPARLAARVGVAHRQRADDGGCQVWGGCEGSGSTTGWHWPCVACCSGLSASLCCMRRHGMPPGSQPSQPMPPPPAVLDLEEQKLAEELAAEAAGAR